MRAGATLLAVAVVGTAALGVGRGCAGASAGDGDGAPQSQQPHDGEHAVTTCSAKLETMNGRRCSGDLECSFPVTCGAFVQNATCACLRGRIACTDTVGLVAADASPRCLDLAGPSGAPCPTTFARTEGLACDAVGKLCTFPGVVCDGRLGVRSLDYCECARRADGALAFGCHTVPCPPSG